MKNKHKRNLLAVDAHFRKAGSHKDKLKDKKEMRRRHRKSEKDIDKE